MHHEHQESAMSSQQLHRKYQESLADKVVQLRQAFDVLCDEDVPIERVAQLHLLLHRLAGSAGTYGFAELSRQARALEEPWHQWLAQDETVRPPAYQVCVQQGVDFAAFLDALRQTAAQQT
jgi:HPt (histidine-containing phosphotransfer) domain-containing protein